MPLHGWIIVSVESYFFGALTFDSCQALNRPSFQFRRCLGGGSLAGDYQRNVLVLRSIIMDLLTKMGDHGAGRQRNRARRIVFRARADPPGSRYDGYVPVVRMEMRMAHMVRGPSGEDNVHTRLRRVTSKDGCVRAVLAMNPVDLVRQLVRDCGRVELRGRRLGRSHRDGYRDHERDDPVMPPHPRSEHAFLLIY